MPFSFRFISSRAFLCAALVACTITIFPGSGRAETAPDLSTPKKAGIAFAKAMEADDLDAMKKAAIGTDAQFAIIKGFADMFAAMTRFNAASVRKFGEKGKLPPEELPDLVGDVEKKEEKIDGGNAKLVGKDSPDEKNPMTLKKQGGLWKVDLGTMPPEIAGMAVSARKIVDGIDAVSRDVDAGKYKTPAEALTAMQAAIVAAIR